MSTIAATSYSDLLLDEWGVDKQSLSLKACVRRVLSELSIDAHLTLRREPRLQVVILPESVPGFRVWSYFPIYERRSIVQQLADIGISTRPSTRVLLVISETLSEDEADYLRDGLGHVLLYLRSPRATNDCDAAMREWNSWRSQ
jgi:hypothetical protein